MKPLLRKRWGRIIGEPGWAGWGWVEGAGRNAESLGTFTVVSWKGGVMISGQAPVPGFWSLG